MISPLRAIAQNYANYTMTAAIKTQGQFCPTIVTQLSLCQFTPILNCFFVCLRDWGKVYDPNLIFMVI